MKLRLKVVPGASREGIEWLDDEQTILKVRVTAPPEKGKANKAVIRALAAALAVSPRDVAITSGGTSQQKMVTIEGLDAREVRARLARA